MLDPGGAWLHISVSLRERDAWPTFLFPHLFLPRSTWSRSSWSTKPFPTISSSLRTTWKCALRKWVSLWNWKKIKSSALRSGEANINSLRSVPPRYPTTSTSERRNQSLKRIRRRRAEPQRTARAPKVGSPDSDTLRISRDTPGWGEKAGPSDSFFFFFFFVLYYYKTRILTVFSRFICFVFFALWHPVTAGVHLRPIAALDAGHVQRSHEASPHEHRRRHRVFLALP